MLTATSYGADGATFRQKFRRQGLFWFFQGLTAGYKLPGIVRQRATSLSAVQLVQGFCFCSLPCTFRYTRVRFLELRASRTRNSASMRTPGSAEGLHFSAFHWIGCCLENRVSWVQIPPEAANFFPEKGFPRQPFCFALV